MNPIHHERLTFSVFKDVYGGAAVTDLAKEKINHVPDGFSAWKTRTGMLMAIRDE